MSGRCPYIGLEGNRAQVYLTDHPRHRCYVTDLPQRVGGAHQGVICLTSGYHRCPRFRASRAEPASQGQGGARGLALADAGMPGGREQLSPRAAAADRPRYTDLRPAPRRLWGSGWPRRPTRTEGTVLGLLVCIVCATIFVGYGILSRVQVGLDRPLTAIAQLAAPAASATPTLAPRIPLAPTSGPAPESIAESPAESPPASAQEAPSPQELAAPTIPPTPTPTVLPASGPVLEPTPGHQPGASPTSVEATPPPPTPLPEPTLTSEAPGRPAPATSPPTRLVLPAINLNVPVRPVQAKTVGQGASAKKVWDELPNAAGFHDTSAYPGNAGNTVINGHRDTHAAVFRKLDQVQVGDEILLYVGPVAYAYRVAEILVVPETFATPAQKAENQRLIGYLPEERLTLITCTPVGLATHRLLIIARPSR